MAQAPVPGTNGGNGQRGTRRNYLASHVLDVLRQGGGHLSQPDLAEQTGFPRATLARLLDDLEDKRLVERQSASAVPGETGRPAKTVAVRADQAISIGIDLGHTHVRVAGGNFNGEVPVFDGSSGTDVLDVDQDPDRALDVAADLARHAETTLRGTPGFRRAQLLGVCVGFPAPIDREKGTVRSEVITPQWRGRRPAEELRRRLNWDVPFFLVNDANLGGLAERHLGAARQIDDFVYLKWAAGIGAAVFANGALVRGTGGAAGEVGHVPVPGETKAVCPRCGRVGCLEAVVAGDAIVRRIEASPSISSPPSDFPSVIEQANEGVGRAREVLQDAAQTIGESFGSIISTLNPRLLVIGGHFDAPSYGYVSSGIRRGLAHRTFGPALDDLDIVIGERHGRAVAEGATLHVLLTAVHQLLE